MQIETNRYVPEKNLMFKHKNFRITFFPGKLNALFILPEFSIGLD